MMNIFRLTGDIIHLLSFFILIQKIRRSKNCLGISSRSLAYLTFTSQDSHSKPKNSISRSSYADIWTFTSTGATRPTTYSS